MVLSTADSLAYSVLLFIMFLFDMFVVFLIYTLGLSNPRDEDGNILGISFQKYIKVVLIGLMWGFILITLNLMVALATELTDLTQFEGLLGFLFSSMLSLSWVWTICIIIWIVRMIYNDSTIRKDIERLTKEAENHV